MLYSILIQGSEDRVAAWTSDEEAEVMGRHARLRADLSAQGRLGPVMRLAPGAATRVRRVEDRLVGVALPVQPRGVRLDGHDPVAGTACGTRHAGDQRPEVEPADDRRQHADHRNLAIVA